jgi:hypothetical protein
MSDDIHPNLDGNTDQAGAGSAQSAAGTATPMPRGRKLIIGGAAVAVVVAGGGAVAAAATNHNGGPAVGYGYRSSGGYGGPGTAGGPSQLAHTPHLEGTVTAVSGTTIKIKDRDGFTRTIRTTSATKYSGGLAKAPVVGDVIHAEGKVDADQVSLDATSITKDTDPGRHGSGWRPGGPGGSGGSAGSGAPTGTAKPSVPAPSSSPTA